MNKTATLEDIEADASPAISGNSGVSEPVTVVLFGASGDLAKRKVIPAMYDLVVNNSLGPRYAIVGFARTPMSDESFRSTTGDAAKRRSGMNLRRIFITRRANTGTRRISRSWRSGWMT